ncbi:MAG: reverse transcriptase family protein, partial [Desulfobacterales bacterium]
MTSRVEAFCHIVLYRELQDLLCYSRGDANIHLLGLPDIHMSRYRQVAKSLADAFAAGDSTVEEMEERGIRAMGENYPWLRGLCTGLLEYSGGDLLYSRLDEWVDFIVRDERFSNAWREGKRPRIRFYFTRTPRMEGPPRSLVNSGVRSLPSIGSISQWLSIGTRELEWYAGKWNGERRAPQGPLRHYNYRWEHRPDRVPRLIEAPKDRLREIQRRILRDILDRIPPHDAAHGFTKGRSCLTFCRPHVKRRIVIRLDLKNFFPCIRWGRVYGVFRTMGYPRETAHILTGLCANQVPDDVLAGVPADLGIPGMSWHERKTYQSPHLPQGAPTSPSIANLCTYRMDLRLKG